MHPSVSKWSIHNWESDDLPNWQMKSLLCENKIKLRLSVSRVREHMVMNQPFRPLSTRFGHYVRTVRDCAGPCVPWAVRSQVWRLVVLD